MTKTRNLSDLLDANGDVKSGSLDNVPAVDLTNLSASNLTSGTVADARLPSTALNSNVDLTTLSASNLTSGTLPDARFPATLPAVSGANLTNLPASGADLEHILTTTATIGSGANVNSVDFSNVFSTTYKHYRLVANNIFGNVASLLQLKLQIGGSYNTSDYYAGIDSVYAHADGQSAEIRRGWNLGYYQITSIQYNISDSSNPSMVDIMFYAPKDSTKTILNTQFMINHSNLTATVSGNSSCLHNSASSVTGFQIYPVSGQIGGTFSLYGIKN